MAVNSTCKLFILFVILHLHAQLSCGELTKPIPVPHTAMVGHKITNLVYWGQQFKLIHDPYIKNVTKFFHALPDGRIITNSDVSHLLGKKIQLIVENKLGSQSWQDVIPIEVKDGHSMFIFSSQMFEGHVLENQPPKTVVEGLEDLIVKTDSDIQSNVLYTIVSGPKDLFKLVQHSDHSLTIVTLKQLDREKKDKFLLKVKAWTDTPRLEYTYTEVTLFVDDENDNTPYFEKTDYYTTISNDLPSLSTVFYVQAIDPDVGKLKYSCEPSSKMFSVDPDCGHVILKSRARLIAPVYNLHIFATDPDGKRSNVTILHISVDGVLRFSPYRLPLSRHKRDTQPAKEVEIPESYVGDLLDIVNNPYDRFRLKKPAPKMLEINPISGTVRLKDRFKLDYEKQPEIEFTVIITQTNDKSYHQEQKVRIKLTDDNDEFPEFINQPRPFLATVSQNAGPGTSVYQLMARDNDQESDIEYSLESGGEDRFVVDIHTGIVRTAGIHPFKYKKEYVIGVSATDVSAEQLQKTPTHSLKILVGSRAPQFFKPLYTAEVSENARPGTEIVHIMAYSFQGFPVTYKLKTSADLDQNNFAINPSTGVVDLLRQLDYETDPHQYHLRVKATENGQVEITSTINLVINLVDENDNSPTFPLSQYIVKGIAETVAIGTPIIVVTATDSDSVTNAQLTYTVTDSNFTVHSANNIGYIKTARRLDYDYIPDHTYNFTVIATDNGSPPRNGSATVRVGVTNVNDENPVFAQTVEHVQLSEDAHDTMVHVVQAYDPDGDDVTYTFLDGRVREDPFKIDSTSGIITLYGQLDRRRTSYKLNITCTDNGMCCGGSTSRSSRGQVVVEIKDINNNAPSFPDCSSYSPQVYERSRAGTNVLTVRASDPDRGANGNVSYSVVKSGDQSSEYFSVNRYTGQVKTADVFDRESKTGVTDLGLTIKAEDQGSPSLAGFCTFRVKIGDVNDNPPVFDLPNYSTSTEESSIIGKKVLQVYATDRDSGENGHVEYSITADNSQGFFTIESNTGWIKVAKPMSGRSDVKLKVQARDRGSPYKFSEVNVHIRITQTVNAYPQWVEDYSQQVIRLSENAPRDYIVKRLKAISTVEDTPFVNYVIQAGETPDQNGKPESFHSRIDEETNEMLLMVYKSLDYEIINTYTLNIKAANRATNSIHNDTRIRIMLIDENDEIPMFIGLDENGRYSGTVPENSETGTKVIRVTATDRDALDEYNKVTYRLKHIYDFEMFSVDHETGQISTTAMFDREKKSEYYVMVVAEDNAKSDRPNHYPPGTPNQGEVEVQIRITDMNDERPYFKQKEYTASVPENADPESVIITVTAEDKDEENTLTYSITGGNIGNAFEVDSALGKIKVRGALDYERGPKKYNLRYRVFDDKFDNTTIVTIYVTDVNDNPPRFQAAVYNVTDLVEEEEGITRYTPKRLITVKASDPDTDRDSNIRYSLNGQFSKDGTFTIDQFTGDIFLTRPLDRDKPKGRPVWNFNVLAHDEPGTDTSLTGYAEVRVMPHDINDNAPEFSENFLTGRVTEHSRQGFSVLTVMAEDRDSGNNGSVTYSLKQVPMKGNSPLFTIDRDLGLITTTMTDALDREIKDVYDTVIVQAKDRGPNQRSASATVTIYIEDINDHAPKFTQKVYRTTMSENLPVDASITSVSATDADIGENAKLTYTLEEKDRNFFSMTSVWATNTGVLRVYKQPDFDELRNPTFNLTVYVTDIDENHKDVAYIEVNITDFNDNAPEFNPNVQPVTIFENVSIATSLARFTARDIDRGLNRQFTYSIERRTDPGRQYSVDGNGLVTVARSLDREGDRGPNQRIHVLAIDKGTPSQTGTGTLMVTLLDVNDNPPQFAEDYRPVVYENTAAGKIVANISAVDKDTVANGPPFEFRLPCGGQCPCNENPTCDSFDFTFIRGGKDSYGLGVVRSLRVFDRERQKEYHMPIIMTDSGKPPMTGTSTLTIVIGDINDNLHKPGHKNVFVYNYKGAFKNVYLGTVYAEDLDDWDINNKTFSFSDGPISLFRLDQHTGALFTRDKIKGGEYTLTVRVYDAHWGNSVSSTVTVTIQEIGDDAVYSSGSVRFTGTTAEEFTDRPKVCCKITDYGKSKYDMFRMKLAQKLNIPVENVDIFTVMNHPTLPKTIDVRFAAHNSPYYKPARLDGIISESMDEFSKDLGLKIAMVPIDECLKENCESGGCSNELVTSGQPLVINTNGTSLIGVTAYIVAECKCAARDFSGNQTNCKQPGVCLNGGTCIQREHSVVCQCPHGFDGPRCQQMHHHFIGHGWAWYEPLAQCEDSHTSLEFMTKKSSGVILYNGPIRDISGDEPSDYMILELRHGYPQLRINHGSGEAKLTMDGRNSFGALQMKYLHDGQWHRIDIFRRGKHVKMIVDKCKNSIIEEHENVQSSSEDRRHCESKGETHGMNKYLNVNTPLQLGGIAKRDLAYPKNLPKHSFSGCIKNLMHNGQLYDLHIGKVGNHLNSEDGCPAEDLKCNLFDLSGPVCGRNGTCIANLNDDNVHCQCNPGWRGPKCSIPTTTKDFKTESYIEWDFKEEFYEKKVDNKFRRITNLQLMFRTRQQNGMLFLAQNAHKSEYLILEVEEMHLRFRYNLGSGEQHLDISFVNVSDGYWHTATVERVGQWVTLTLDQGEGRNYNYTLGQPEAHREIRVSRRSIFAGGDVRFSASSSIVLVDDDYRHSCMNDVRYNGEWFPMDTSQTIESEAAEVQRSDNLDDVCESTACVGMYCIPPLVCMDLWRHADCRCPVGQEFVGGQAMCANINECLSHPCVQGHCVDTPSGYYCECYDGYHGDLCGAARRESAFVDLSMGAILAIIICALVLILVIMIFIIYSRRRRPQSYVTGVDPDDDVRENIIHYDEEGVGEEDQDAYDINRLKKPMQESPPMRQVIIPPPVAIKPNKKAPLQHSGPPPAIEDFIRDRQHEIDNDPNAPPHDSVREYAYEGGGSDAGSLSSLASTTDVDDQDFDYLSNWGPRFNKLANMYGEPYHQRRH